MITVKLYGLLRITSGIKERQMEVTQVREVLEELLRLGISKKDVSGCIILINGTPGSKRSKLNDGDVVQLLSPVAGG